MNRSQYKKILAFIFGTTIGFAITWGLIAYDVFGVLPSFIFGFLTGITLHQSSIASPNPTSHYTAIGLAIGFSLCLNCLLIYGLMEISQDTLWLGAAVGIVMVLVFSLALLFGIIIGDFVWMKVRRLLWY